MRPLIVSVPIDFGHTEYGVYKRSGVAEGSYLWAETLYEQLALLEPELIEIDIRPPEFDENPKSPMKFASLLGEAVLNGLKQLEGYTCQEYFPIFLGGDHTTSLLTACWTSQQSSQFESIGALVLDAHTDFNLPGLPPIETPSGNTHGMIHSILSDSEGVEWQSLDSSIQSIHEMSKLKSNQVSIHGVRAKRYTKLKRTLFRLQPELVTAQSIVEFNDEAYSQLCLKSLSRVTQAGLNPFYFSIDCDGFDPGIFPWVNTPIQGGVDLNIAMKMFECIQSDSRYRKQCFALDIVEANFDHPEIGYDFRYQFSQKILEFMMMKVRTEG